MLSLARRFLPAELVLDQFEDDLEEEWQSLQFSRTLPNDEDAAADSWWNEVLATKTANGALRYPSLAQLIPTLLVLPYNQAAVERAFSLVRKNATEFRPTLSTESVAAILSCKINCDEDIWNFKPPHSLVLAARSATVNSNLTPSTSTSN